MYPSSIIQYLGMIGGGFLGGVLGLPAGICFWLAQYLTGETVEERWKREFLHSRNIIAAKGEEAAAKDLRREIIDEKKVEWKESDEDNTWLRRTIIELRLWAEKNGYLPRPPLSSDEADKQLSNEITNLSK